MTTQANPDASTHTVVRDERVKERNRLQRLMIRPEVGAAIGAILHRPPEFTEDAEAAIARVTAAGLTPLVLDAHGGRPLGQLALPRRAALILGEEGQGFAGQSLPADTVRVTIEGGLPGRPRDSAATYHTRKWHTPMLPSLPHLPHFPRAARRHTARYGRARYAPPAPHLPSTS